MNNLPQQTLTWKIGGEAGFGIMTVGLMFSKVSIREGFHIFDYVEYPSLIRGGHNVYEVRVSSNEVYCQERKVDILVALNQETVSLHKDEMKDDSVIIYDNEKTKISATDFAPSVILLAVPIAKIIKEAGASLVMQNNVALGASCAVIGFSKETMLLVIKDMFLDKGEQVVKDNSIAATLGYDYVSNNYKDKFAKKLTPSKTNDQIVLTGNEAIGLAALASDCRFYCAYPMSPSSSLLHFMAAKADECGIVVKHAEDEIAVINMGIGASYGGIRAMVGTSGGGFSLMVEGLGLAGLTETSLVIFEGQRPGPATGLPTWTAQADLEFLMHAAQDEFPRIILSPGDVEEAFWLTVEAFNLADIYQTPVFILSDKYLAESHKSAAPFDFTKIKIDRGKLITSGNTTDLSKYLRYQDTSDGISPRVIVGTKGTYFLTNSYEHEENGLSTEDSSQRIKQVNKRARKLVLYENNLPAPNLYGDMDSDITLIAWGSTKGPVISALAQNNYVIAGKTVNFLHLNHVWPLPRKAISNILSRSKKRIMIEGNSTGQMGKVLRRETGVVVDDYLLKYDGRPFYEDEIIDKVTKSL
ncbi:2-oxoacid:acceptor oxidoreductase subunit alpha [Candidatus Gottesmanbacteria bacterium]|nr:2-oxoacid:acceptor oxidoreductase subunit alpha [Candidatus Gottesmanbacteria bacterium]